MHNELLTAPKGQSEYCKNTNEKARLYSKQGACIINISITRCTFHIKNNLNF